MGPFSLEGKTAIVTGAGRGIGKSVALGLADAGSNIVICRRTTTELTDVANEIQKKGREVLVIPCDVSNTDDINNVIQKSIESFHTIDILVNNAGITKKNPAEEFLLEDWNQI